MKSDIHVSTICSPLCVFLSLLYCFSFFFFILFVDTQSIFCITIDGDLAEWRDESGTDHPFISTSTQLM